MNNYQSTIISQYATGPILTEWLARFNDEVDPSGNINDFVSKELDIKTATGYGLDVLGRLVDVTRYIPVVNLNQYFGFEESANSFSPFNVYPFYNNITIFNGLITLGDDAFRTLILAKSLANITACSAPQLNKLMNLLFAGRGVCYSSDLGSMQMQYVFDFALAPYEISILGLSGILPKPTGVTTSLLVQGVPIVI
jgi:hypothetical protein